MVVFYATININNYEYNIQSAGAGMCQTRYKLCLTTCVGLLPVKHYLNLILVLPFAEKFVVEEV
jgi:hypothetical protein